MPPKKSAAKKSASKSKAAPATSTASKPASSSKRKDRLARVFAHEVIQKLHKDAGVMLIQRAVENKAIEDLRIPSGVTKLDLALGGGWPVGRVINLWGHKSSGKTTLLLKTIANAQKMCSNCWTFPGANNKCACGDFRDTVVAYIDVEGALDKRWMLRQGVDIDRLLLSQPALAEQALQVADSLLQTGDIDILVLDSIAFLRPRKEAEKTMDEGMVGEQARIVGRGTRSWVSNLNFAQLKSGRRPTIFTTNQIRMKVGVMFGNPETQPGGMAPGFAASVEVKTRAGKVEYVEDGGEPLSALMHFSIEKNKTGTGRKEGQYTLIKKDTEKRRLGDVADEDDVIELAEQFGLITKPGNDWLCLEEKFDAKGHIIKRVMEDVHFNRALRNAILRTARYKDLKGVRGLVDLPPELDEDEDELQDEAPEADAASEAGA